MRVVIGLGNPGKKYEKTRHNIGFIAVNNLRKKLNVNDEREKFQALVSEKNIDGEKVIFFKPQTFMNLSGNSVIEIVNFYIGCYTVDKTLEWLDNYSIDNWHAVTFMGKFYRQNIE